MTYRFTSGFIALAMTTALATPALAADLVRVANSQKGLWDQTLIEFGDQTGIFDKYDIDLEILWTDGGADAQQAVIAGSMDIAVGTGALGVISAHSKGAPIEILGASMTGSSDLYWFVKSDSEIKSFADTAGKTVAFSRPGSSTNLVAAALVTAAGTDAKLVPTGGPAATLTQVMSDQIDVGWAAAPVGLDREAAGEIRVIASGNDAPGVKDQSVRVHVVNANFLEQNPDVVKRFLQAYRETLDWAYESDEAVTMWAEMNSLEVDTAKDIRDRIYPREVLQLHPVKGMDRNIQEAIDNKRLDAPLTEEQVNDMMAVSKEFETSLKN